MDSDEVDWMDMPESAAGGDGGGGRGDRKRRFNEEQIKSLESMFATQTKLEPRQKLQLARELNLQPRQVAIWFQNKRARWKSKQLEKEYTALREDYDALLSSYESLKKEKQVLLKQLEKLAELLQEPQDGRSKHGNAHHGGITDGGGDVRSIITMKQEVETRTALYSNEADNGLMNFGDDEASLFRTPSAQSNFAQAPTAEQPFHFHASWASDQTCSSSQWWNFESLSE